MAAHRMSAVTQPACQESESFVTLSSKSIIYQQMHFISVLENIKIYIKTYIKIAVCAVCCAVFTAHSTHTPPWT